MTMICVPLAHGSVGFLLLCCHCIIFDHSALDFCDLSGDKVVQFDKICDLESKMGTVMTITSIYDGVVTNLHPDFLQTGLSLITVEPATDIIKMISMENSPCQTYVSGRENYTITKWFVKTGDTVAKFDKICIIQNNMAETYSYTSTFDGVVTNLNFEVSDTIEPGSPLITMEDAGGRAITARLALQPTKGIMEITHQMTMKVTDGSKDDQEALRISFLNASIIMMLIILVMMLITEALTTHTDEEGNKEVDEINTLDMRERERLGLLLMGLSGVSFVIFVVILRKEFYQSVCRFLNKI